MKTIGQRIRFVRDQKKLTLGQLAKKAGISKSYLWQVEQDWSNITVEKLLRLANVLGASLGFLLQGESPAEDRQARVVEIPKELEELAEEIGLSYWQTRTLLEAELAIRSRRSSKTRTTMEKEDWRKFYQGLKPFLEEKQ